MLKLEKFTLTIFWQKFRESKVFTKELILRNILWWERIYRFCTLWILREISVHNEDFFCYADFTWNQICRFLSPENCLFGSFKSSKSLFWMILHHEILRKIAKNANSESLKLSKRADFEIQNSQKMLSHKIWSAEKFCNFRTVPLTTKKTLKSPWKQLILGFFTQCL